jgi:hypothetical protein
MVSRFRKHVCNEFAGRQLGRRPVQNRVPEAVNRHSYEKPSCASAVPWYAFAQNNTQKAQQRYS